MESVISIISPNYNRASLLGETAASIFRQEYPHWEWVVVDDGSTDNSLDLLSGYAANDPRVKVFSRDRAPKGACTCRNIAIEKATGDYLIFLDTDDLLAPHCLQQRVEAIDGQPELDYVVFPALLFKSKPDDLRLLWNIEKEESEIDRLLRADPICQGTGTIWRKDAFLRIGAWNESLALWQDIELHLRAHLKHCKHRVRFDLRPDIYIRITDGSLSRSGFYSLPKQKSRVRVLIDVAARMKQLDIFKEHFPAIKHLAVELLVSSIKYRYFKMAKELLAYSYKEGLITVSEKRRIQFYFSTEKWRITRLPGVNRIIQTVLPHLPVANDYSLGKIYYEGELDY